MIWENRSGHTVYLQELALMTTTANVDSVIFYERNATGANVATIDSITAVVSGTGSYYGTLVFANMADGAIADGNQIMCAYYDVTTAAIIQIRGSYVVAVGD